MTLHTTEEASHFLWKVAISLPYLQKRVASPLLNLLTPNVNYSGHTAQLTSKVAFYIFIQQI